MNLSSRKKLLLGLGAGTIVLLLGTFGILFMKSSGNAPVAGGSDTGVRVQPLVINSENDIESDAETDGGESDNVSESTNGRGHGDGSVENADSDEDDVPNRDVPNADHVSVHSSELDEDDVTVHSSESNPDNVPSVLNEPNDVAVRSRTASDASTSSDGGAGGENSDADEEEVNSGDESEDPVEEDPEAPRLRENEDITLENARTALEDSDAEVGTNLRHNESSVPFTIDVNIQEIASETFKKDTYKVDYGSFDMSFSNDESRSYRVFFARTSYSAPNTTVGTSNPVVEDVRANIADLGPEALNIKNIFPDLITRELNGVTFYATDFLDLDKMYGPNAQDMERSLRYSGMKSFISNLNEEALGFWDGTTVFFIVPGGQVNLEDYPFERNSVPDVTLVKSEAVQREYKFNNRLVSGLLSYVSLPTFYNYILRTVTIDNVFGKDGQNALRIDFYNDKRDPKPKIELSQVALANESLPFFVNSLKPEVCQSLPDYERTFGNINEIEFEGFKVLYSNAAKLEKDYIHTVLQKIKAEGKVVAGFDHLLNQFSFFPETSILLIGDKEQLAELIKNDLVEVEQTVTQEIENVLGSVVNQVSRDGENDSTILTNPVREETKSDEDDLVSVSNISALTVSSSELESDEDDLQSDISRSRPIVQDIREEMINSFEIGAFDIALAEDGPSDYRLFYFIGNNDEDAVPCLKKAILKLSVDHFDIYKVLTNLEEYSRGGVTYYKTKSYNQYEFNWSSGLTIESMESRLRYLGMVGLIESLSEEEKQDWKGRNIYFAVRNNADNVIEKYAIKKDEAVPTIKKDERLVSKDLGGFSIFGYNTYFYRIRTVEIENLFSVNGQSALLLDFHIDDSNVKAVTAETFSNFTAFKQTFGDIAELLRDYDNLEILYTNPAKLKVDKVMGILGFVKYFGLVEAFNDKVYPESLYPASILLIGDKEKLDKFKRFDRPPAGISPDELRHDSDLVTNVAVNPVDSDNSDIGNVEEEKMAGHSRPEDNLSLSSIPDLGEEASASGRIVGQDELNDVHDGGFETASDEIELQENSHTDINQDHLEHEGVNDVVSDMNNSEDGKNDGEDDFDVSGFLSASDAVEISTNGTTENSENRGDIQQDGIVSDHRESEDARLSTFANIEDQNNLDLDESFTHPVHERVERMDDTHSDEQLDNSDLESIVNDEQENNRDLDHSDGSDDESINKQQLHADSCTGLASSHDLSDIVNEDDIVRSDLKEEIRELTEEISIQNQEVPRLDTALSEARENIVDASVIESSESTNVEKKETTDEASPAKAFLKNPIFKEVQIMNSPIHSLKFGAIDISLHDERTVDFRVFYAVGRHSGTMKNIYKSLSRQSAESFDIHNTFGDLESFVRQDGTTTYKTKLTDAEGEPIGLSIQNMESRLRYFGMEKLLETLSEEELQAWEDKNIFFIVRNKDNEHENYKVKKYGGQQSFTENTKTVQARCSVFYTCNYTIRTIAIKNVFGVKNQGALRIDFLYNDREEITNSANFPDINAYKRMFTGTEEIQYGDLYVLYSDSSKVKDQINDVLTRSKYYGLENAFQELYKNSYFPDTSILLIGDKKKLDKFMETENRIRK